MTGLKIPTSKNKYRVDAFMASNNIAIMNAACMYYGGAKKGKTRTLTAAFAGSEYVFLDFDRNYESTAKNIEDRDGIYFNGSNAWDVLHQLADGEISGGIFIIDALGSVSKKLAIRWNTRLEPIDVSHIGVTHEATVDFFNRVIEPMTANNNSVNFIHHTTQSGSGKNAGEKMEGNKGAWLSAFDFTYSMTEPGVFNLDAGRLPIAPKTISAADARTKAREWFEKKGMKPGDTMTQTEFKNMTKNSQWVVEYKNKLFIEDKVTNEDTGRQVTQLTFNILPADIKVKSIGEVISESEVTSTKAEPTIEADEYDGMSQEDRERLGV